MASARRRGVQVLLLGIGLAVACALAGWAVFAGTVGRIKQWDVDARGPVLLSADGRALTFTSVPDPALHAGACLGDVTVRTVVEEHTATVAVHFHLRRDPWDTAPVVGVCAVSTRVRVDLTHPLAARTLTDAHGRPLRTVSEADFPRPGDPRLVEHPEGTLCVAQQASGPNDCLGTAALVRGFYAHSASTPDLWTLLQSLDAATSVPAPAWTGQVPRATVNGTAAECGPLAPGEVAVDWAWARGAQRLVLESQNSYGAVPTPGRLCARALAMARTVR